MASCGATMNDSFVSRPSVPKLRTFCKATVASASLMEYNVPSYRIFFLEINEMRLPVENSSIRGVWSEREREGECVDNRKRRRVGETSELTAENQMPWTCSRRTVDRRSSQSQRTEQRIMSCHGVNQIKDVCVPSLLLLIISPVTQWITRFSLLPKAKPASTAACGFG